MVFVPEAEAAVLYGGYTPAGDLDDVWLLDYGDPGRPTWRSLDPAVPGARSGHAGCWDAVGARMVVVGGLRGIDTSVHALGDAWALYLAGGPEPTPSATPPLARVDVFLPVADRSYVAP